MFRKLIKNKKAQNTAEYAILISLVVAGIIAMQTYAQRALQAKVRDASHFLATSTNRQGFGNTVQYEPYYLSSNYELSSEDYMKESLTNSSYGRGGSTNSMRRNGGYEQMTYNTIYGVVNGI